MDLSSHRTGRKQGMLTLHLSTGGVQHSQTENYIAFSPVSCTRLKGLELAVRSGEKKILSGGTVQARITNIQSLVKNYIELLLVSQITYSRISARTEDRTFLNM